jgi:antitoxin component YwqK of YwqJK toxin-antitoxin module
MKTILPILFLIVILTACLQQKEVILEKYPSGSKKVTHILHTDNTNDSIIKVIIYRENGNVSTTGILLGDKPHGIWTQWYIDVDQKQVETNFSRFKKEGIETFWYKNGQKKQEVNYSGDLKNGIEIQWLENGNKKSHGAWEQDKKTGQWTYWHENGKIKEQGIYNGGQFEVLSAFSSKAKPDFIPQKDKEWIYWTESGDIFKVEHYEQGQLKKE